MVLDELQLDVQVADSARGTAKFLELAHRLRGLCAEGRQVFESVKQIEECFDAVALGAKFVDSFGSRVGERDGDRGFERGGVLAEGLDRVGGGRGWGWGRHEARLHLPPPKG